jgi:16S rRNA (adenine1518-N6/adenine1519-N6)-dimethyltransferase
VELDRGLAGHLGGLAERHPGRLTILHRDILSVGDDELVGGPRRFVCGNLPYNIASPLLFWFLAHRRRFTGAVFMLQKEMARRLTASPGGRDYGRLAAALSLWCRLSPLFDVPPSAFHPRPGVDSAVVGLTPLSPEEEPALEPETFGRFTAAAFAARRQTLRNNLSRAYGPERTAAALTALDLDPARRAETLAPHILAELAKLLEH